MVYKWFDYLHSQNHAVVGYVIMPSHVHVMIDFFLKHPASLPRARPGEETPGGKKSCN